MDAHLSSLETSLSALSQLHRKKGSSSRRAQPFTNGVLNKYDLDVLDFIRDADPFETNLFWYPPGSASSAASGLAPTSSRIAASTAVSGALLEESTAMAKQSLGAPQVPEPRQFVPPTPLRRDARRQGTNDNEQQDFDTRTLLKAAQKLMDNYHNAPRARKHVKALLRRNAELQKTIQGLDENLTETSDLIARLSHPTQGKGFVSAVKRASTAHRTPATKQSHDISEEKRELAAEIRKEEMEIMAIEQTLEELLSQKKSSSVRNLAAASDTKEEDKIAEGEPVMDAGAVDTSSSNIAVEEPTNELADETIRIPSTSAPSQGHVDEQTTESSPSGAIQSSTSEKVEAKARTAVNDVETSDELERICENIWSIFGDHLRFVLPGREGADLQETLTALHNLSVGFDDTHKADGSDDISMASASGVSHSTVATTGSTVSSASTDLPSAGPPTPMTMLAAHELALLLTTPAPHTLDFDVIKRDAAEWWASVGLASLRQQQQTRKQGDSGALAVAKAIDALGTEIANGDSLAVKAIYDLAAKKLLKIRFAGARRIVFFPANIV